MGGVTRGEKQTQVSAPGRGASAMIEKLREALTEEAHQKLSDLQQAVVRGNPIFDPNLTCSRG